MAKRLPVLGLAALASLSILSPSSAATPARVLASDDRGITFRVDVPAWRLAPTGTSGVQRLVVHDLEATDVPGRAGMPFAAILIALPPGARAAARVIEQ